MAKPENKQSLPDVRSMAPDLVAPNMMDGSPTPGKRIKQTTVGYEGTEVYHTVYLPVDWHPGRKYPVIVEYAGNGHYSNNTGDTCTGRVEDSNLGYGISGGKGVIWICMPFVDRDRGTNAITWWGDVEATVDYCQKTVKQVCREYDGDLETVFIAGFSRGAIAGNFIGLHDDSISSLWSGFILCSHYDGVITWPYPDSERAAAVARLQRLEGRPQFICHERSVQDTRDYLDAVCPEGDFTFQILGFRNHTDEWVLRDIPERRALRAWFDAGLKQRRHFNGRGI